MEPLKRPFADWVDDRVLPACQNFTEDHPWISAMLLGLLWLGFRAIVSGSWRVIAIGAGAWLVLGVYLAIGWDRRRRERQVERLRERNICLHCGYDMRATPQRCPECGSWADEPVGSENPEG